MQIRPVVDRQAAVSLAAATDEWADYLNRSLRQAAGRSSRYSPQFRSQLLDRSGDFPQRGPQAARSLGAGRSRRAVAQHGASAAESWNLLAESLGKLQPPDRARSAEASEQICPALAKLQVLVAY